MQVKGNAEEVGLRTTLAVVQAIFMVIVLDAFFAVFFTGWGGDERPGADRSDASAIPDRGRRARNASAST
jgi:hypothetical protein